MFRLKMITGNTATLFFLLCLIVIVNSGKTKDQALKKNFQTRKIVEQRPEERNKPPRVEKTSSKKAANKPPWNPNVEIFTKPVWKPNNTKESHRQNDTEDEINCNDVSNDTTKEKEFNDTSDSETENDGDEEQPTCSKKKKPNFRKKEKQVITNDSLISSDCETEGETDGQNQPCASKKVRTTSPQSQLDTSDLFHHYYYENDETQRLSISDSESEDSTDIEEQPCTSSAIGVKKRNEDKMRKSAKRASETEDQRQARNSEKKMRTAAKRASETEDQRQARNSEKKMRTAAKRASETEDQRQARNSEKKMRTAAKRASETEDQRQARNSEKKMRRAAKRTSETEGERRSRIQKERKLSETRRRCKGYAARNLKKIINTDVNKTAMPKIFGEEYETIFERDDPSCYAFDIIENKKFELLLHHKMTEIIDVTGE